MSDSLPLPILSDARRLEALRATGLLDSAPEEGFDRLTRLAATVLRVPVSLVTLVDEDRQFFKSHCGLPEPWASRRQTPLSHSFCQYAVATGEPLVIEDARDHPIVRANLAIPELGVVAYAGIPLLSSDGHVLGSFCVIDHVPRRWTPEEIGLLRDLAASVASEIELRVVARLAEQRAAEAEHEVAQRKRTEDALRLLAEAGMVLGSSLDYEETLRAVARIVIPRLAEAVLVDVADADGLRTVAIAHADPDKEEDIRAVRRHAPTRPAAHPSWRAIETGQTQVVAEMDDAFRRTLARDDEELELLRRVRVSSLMYAPMIARGRTLGVLTLGTAQRRFGADDVPLAQELARRIAVAVDNARLYGDARQATQARDDLLGVVSHDLRNPIHTASMSASLLLDLLVPEEDAQSRTHLRIIKRAMERANRLIQDLLDVRRIETGRLAVERKPVSAAAVLAEAAEFSQSRATEKGIVVTTTCDPGIPVVAADRERVLQVVTNLVDNALKFTPPGGRVTLWARREADVVRIGVTDTGAGIAADQLPRLFDPYWQAQHSDRRGVGLGLAIVKGIVEAHGGRVHAESAPNAGSTFSFTLPVAREGSMTRQEERGLRNEASTARLEGLGRGVH